MNKKRNKILAINNIPIHFVSRRTPDIKPTREMFSKESESDLTIAKYKILSAKNMNNGSAISEMDK